jgi:hypothetical protein
LARFWAAAWLASWLAAGLTDMQVKGFLNPVRVQQKMVPVQQNMLPA